MSSFDLFLLEVARGLKIEFYEEIIDICQLTSDHVIVNTVIDFSNEWFVEVGDVIKKISNSDWESMFEFDFDRWVSSDTKNDSIRKFQGKIWKKCYFHLLTKILPIDMMDDILVFCDKIQDANYSVLSIECKFIYILP